MPVLVYNASIFELTPEVAQDLLDRDVIVVDPYGDADFALGLEHTIDEVEPLAIVRDRSDAPPQSVIHPLKVRGTGWWPFASPGFSGRGTVVLSRDAEDPNRRI